MTIRLDHERLELATAELCAQDPDLEIVVDKFGVQKPKPQILI